MPSLGVEEVGSCQILPKKNPHLRHEHDEHFLPLKSFVDEQVSQRGFGTSSEYVRELIRKDQERLQLRGLLLAGAASNPTTPADASYFEGLQDRVRKAAKPATKA